MFFFPVAARSLAAILVLCMSPMNALVYFVVSQTMCGLLLASVFALNHNGMTVMSKEESKSVDYYTRQVRIRACAWTSRAARNSRADRPVALALPTTRL